MGKQAAGHHLGAAGGVLGRSGSYCRGASCKMNVRRGLFRIWVALTITWLVFCAWIDAFACFHRGGPWCDYWTWENYVRSAAFIFGLPLAAFALGLILLWIGAGFRSKTSN